MFSGFGQLIEFQEVLSIFWNFSIFFHAVYIFGISFLDKFKECCSLQLVQSGSVFAKAENFRIF